MAKLNPDFYTVWNYRKDYLMQRMGNDEKKGFVTALTYSQQDAIQNLMKKERAMKNSRENYRKAMNRR